MKKIVLIFLSLLLLQFAGCGGLTDVGNPTGTVILTGQLNLASLDADLAQVDTGLVVVKAIDENLTEFTSEVDLEGFFNLSVPVGYYYSLYVYFAFQNLGAFSFEQDDQGNRSNRLEIDFNQPGGEVIDMGLVTRQNGEFRPENEPRQQMRQGQ
ncbi:MAG: hypothetical protein ABH859_02635 [Pseudomonadota bacterium]|nr:hypothetical protein [Candidatus Margulisiibacteriota bacterium]